MTRSLSLLALVVTLGVACSGSGEGRGGSASASGSVALGEAYVREVKAEEMGSDVVGLHVVGDLPTPCHKARATAEVDREDPTVVALKVWSVVPSDRVCEQVLTPFDMLVELSGLEPARYSVILDGAEVARFTLD